MSPVSTIKPAAASLTSTALWLWQVPAWRPLVRRPGGSDAVEDAAVVSEEVLQAVAGDWHSLPAPLQVHP